MKTFIFTTQAGRRRRYGGFNITAKIYQIKKNVPCFITEAEWCTAAYRGEESEVMNALIKARALPRKWYEASRNDWRGAGYYMRDNGSFTIAHL